MWLDYYNNIVNYNSNYYKYLSYIANIYKNNYKNNLYFAITDIKIKKIIYIIAIYIIILIMKSKI